VLGGRSYRIGRRALHSGAVVAIAGLAVLVGCGSSSSAAASPTTGQSVLLHGQISHQGRWLVDPSGRVLLLHGINIVEKAAPYYPSAAGFSNADAVWLANNGFRVVRVGILATGLMPTPGVIDERYIAHIAQTVRDLGHHGIYTLLDFHQDGYGPEVGDDGFPGWMTNTGSAVNNHVGFPLYYIEDPATQQAFQSFWDNADATDGTSLQNDYVSMFHAVAQRFANNPDVLGYDVFNEPWPGNTWQACATPPTGCKSLDLSELAPVYAKVVAGIRSAGDSHLVFGEPFVLFNYGLAPTNIPLPGGDPQTGMAFHMYTLGPAQEPDVIANAVKWSNKTGGALLNTEWGAVTDASAIERQADELDTGLVPWIFWSMGEVVNNLELPPTGSNLTTSTVDALVQPYPLAVAGTPKQLTYTPADETLSFRWSTSKPGGGSYATGTTTELVAPSTVYPTGYRVVISGGTVTSRPCASTITVANDPGKRAVSITVLPTGSCPGKA
jgi:endoglycosylceramidase